jgi:hypothetical protein
MIEFKKNVLLAKSTMDPKSFKFEVLLSFWLCLHLQLLDFGRFLLEHDSLLEKILANMRRAGKELLARRKEEELKDLEGAEERIKHLRKKLQENKAKKGILGSMFNKGEQEELAQLEKKSSLSR